MEGLTAASADDLPPLGELLVDDPFWQYPARGLAREGAGHLRVWAIAATAPGYLAVVTETGGIISLTESAGRIWAGLARRYGPSLVLLEHHPAPGSGEGMETLDLVRIGADQSPHWRADSSASASACGDNHGAGASKTKESRTAASACTSERRAKLTHVSAWQEPEGPGRPRLLDQPARGRLYRIAVGGQRDTQRRALLPQARPAPQDHRMHFFGLDDQRPVSPQQLSVLPQRFGRNSLYQAGQLIGQQPEHLGQPAPSTASWWLTFSRSSVSS